ncbi:MAG: ABC transporter permease [Ilumatobacteraceae bacterium]
MTLVEQPPVPEPNDVPAVAASARRRARAAGSRKIRFGLGVTAAIVVFSLVSRPFLADPTKQHLKDRLLPPSTDHWFGTDELGRDVFSRVVHAVLVDLPIGVLCAALAALLGTLIGALAGSRGGWVDALIMRIADIVQAFPTYIFLVALVFALGAGTRSFIVAMVVLGWVTYARLVRSEILRVRDLDFVSAAHLSGFGRARVLFRHILPNSMGQVVVYLASDVVLVLLLLAGVSFFGLGVPPPTPEWGQMIAAGQKYLRDQWWIVTFPGLAIVITGCAVALVADGLEDRTRR